MSHRSRAPYFAMLGLRASLRHVLLTAFIALVYMGLDPGAATLIDFHQVTSPYFLASAWGLIALLRFKLPAVGGILIGSLSNQLLAGTSTFLAVSLALCAVLEAALGFYIIQRLRPQLERVDHQGHSYVISLAAFLPSIASASLTIPLLLWTKQLAPEVAWRSWLYTLMASTLAILTALPLYYYLWQPLGDFLRKPRREAISRQILSLSLSLLSLALALAGSLLFLKGAFAFLLFLPLLLVALYGSNALLHLSSFLLVIATGLAAARGYGPFSDLNFPENLIDLQLFLCSLAFTALKLQGLRQRGIAPQIVAIILGGWLFSGILFFTFHQGLRPDQLSSSTTSREESLTATTENFSLAWIATLGALLTMSLAQQMAGARAMQSMAEKIIAEQMKTILDRERIWDTLMDCAPVGIFYSNEKGEPIYTNPRWREITGITPEETTQPERQAILHDEDRARVLHEWKQTIAQGGRFEGEYRMVRKDGVMFWVHTYAASIIDEQGINRGYVGAALDITARKAQEALLEEERMRSIHAARMASLGEMAASIAHEINNPLAIINAITCELAMMDETLSEEARGRLQRIESTTMRIAKIVRGLRSFSRDSGRDPFEWITLDALFKDVVELCSERFRIHKVDLRIAPLPPCLVRSRGVQLSQVVLNLLSNAFDAVQGTDGAWVAVETSFRLDKLLISILDSGTGIPEATVARMMEPFFTTKGIGRGTGLGLSIAQAITHDHGGHLYYAADRHHTCFVIDLPFRKIEHEQGA